MTGIGKSPLMFQIGEIHRLMHLWKFFQPVLRFVFFGGGNVLLSVSNFETNHLATCMYDLLNWFYFLGERTKARKVIHASEIHLPQGPKD